MNFVQQSVRYYYEAARFGSIRKAAEHLSVSPSAVYRSIQNLEMNLDTQLLERHSKGVVPTSAGRILVQYSERALSDEDLTVDRIRTLSNKQMSISVAGPDGCVPEILTHSFEILLKEFPEVSLLFRSSAGLEALALLEAGTVDIIVHFDLQVTESIAVFYERLLPLGAVIHPQHPLAQEEKLSLEKCCRYPMILPDRSWPMRSALNEAFTEMGLRPDVKTVSSSIQLMKHLVKTTHCLGMQSEVGLQQEIRGGELLHRTLADGEHLDRTLLVCTPAGVPLTAPIQRLAETLRDVIHTY